MPSFLWWLIESVICHVEQIHGAVEMQVAIYPIGHPLTHHLKELAIATDLQYLILYLSQPDVLGQPDSLPGQPQASTQSEASSIIT